MPNPTIIFEEPLNECMRICLRLEFLLDQVTHNISGASQYASRTALASILEAVNVIDRPDLKSKFAKALSQHTNALYPLKEKPHVDQKKLEKILNELEELSQGLYCTQDKTAQLLRGNNFLGTIRQYMANPGGACPFTTHAYYLWLQNPSNIRQEKLCEWFNEFNQIHRIIKILLKLIRESTLPQKLVAYKGYYQQTLDPKLEYHLIRISLPEDKQIYPEISVGRHRLNIRFMELNTDNRSPQCKDDIPFELGCCLPLGSMSQQKVAEEMSS
jgi:cell division protein ZapD